MCSEGFNRAVFPNIPLFSANLVGNAVGLVILTMVLYLLVEFLALLFGINLVESIKNEKIWWLETLKIDLNSISDIVDGKKQLEIFYKKFDCSDLYIPVPIQRFFTFQKYVFFPKWIMKPAIDIETCDDDDFEILKERFNFQRNLIYRQNEQ